MSGQKELTNLIGSKPIERKLRKTYFKLEDVLQKYQPVVYETEVWPRIDLDTPAGHCPFICSREEHKDRLQLHEDLKKGTTTSKRKSLREKRIKRTINYCECCGCSISCLDKHLESTDHKSFVENKENYGQVEDFIKDLNRSSDSFLDQYIQHSIKEQERLEQLKISEEEDKENNSQSANDLDDTLTLHDTFNEVKSSTALRNSHIFEANSASTPNQLCGSSELINSSLSKPKSICSSAGLSAQIESLSLAFKGKANTKTPKTPPIQRLLTSPGFQLQNFNISITPGSMQITPRCVDQNQPLSNVTETECFVSGGFNQELKQRKKRLFSPVNGNGSAREEAQSWANTATDDITGKRFKGNPVEECDSVYADALPSLVKCPDIIEFCETELNSGVNEVSQGIASDCTTPTMSAKSVVSSSSAVKPEFGSPATHHSSDESANSPVIGTKLCISSRPGYVPVEETKEASWQPANEETGWKVP